MQMQIRNKGWRNYLVWEDGHGKHFYNDHHTWKQSAQNF